MNGLAHDLRYGFRQLAKAPGFTLGAVLLLALGIGANTTLFSLIDAVVLRDIPFRDPDRIVMIWGYGPAGEQRLVPDQFLQAWLERSETLEHISIYSTHDGELGGAEEPLDIHGELVSADYFELVGVPPMAGRTFLPGEDQPGAAPVVMIGYSLWQRALGGDPEILGQSISVDQQPYTVVGIMPPGFISPLARSNREYWTPTIPERLLQFSRLAGYNVIARLKDGVNISQAETELALLVEGVELDSEPKQVRPGLTPLHEVVTGSQRFSLSILAAAAFLVLLTACANLAQLVMVRGENRVSEFAARKAFGATPGRILRQCLIENLLLSFLGGLSGLAAAAWLLPVIQTVAPHAPRIEEASLDLRALTVAAGLAVLTGCFFGILPAVRAARRPIGERLRSDANFSMSVERSRSGRILLAGQIAASMVLLVASGLLLRSFLILLPSNPGFAPQERYWTPVRIRSLHYPEAAKRAELSRSLISAIAGIPGVADAALTSHLPFGWQVYGTTFKTVGDTTEIAGTLQVRGITPNYFRLMAHPLLSGRVWSAGERSSIAQPAVVNQALARQIDPGGSALGRVVRISRWSSKDHTFQIVGIFGDARSSGNSLRIENELYIPHDPESFELAYVLVKSDIPPAALSEALHERIRAVVPTAVLEPVVSMEDLLSDSVARPRFRATLVGAFALNALLIAAVGVFSLVAFQVSRRYRELGIRKAVGADRRALLSAVIRPTLVSLALGVAAGVGSSVFVNMALSKHYFGLAPLEWDIITTAAAAILSAALLAAYLPARRAASIDPMEALRHE